MRRRGGGSRRHQFITTLSYSAIKRLYQHAVGVIALLLWHSITIGTTVMNLKHRNIGAEEQAIPAGAGVLKKLMWLSVNNRVIVIPLGRPNRTSCRRKTILYGLSVLIFYSGPSQLDLAV